jgi:hypothetical protein
MRNFFVFLLISLSGIGLVGAEDLNWNGVLDTAIISGFRSDSLKWSRGFGLSAGQDVRVVFKVNDTAIVRLGSDSIGIQWGYMTFCQCLDTSQNVSTPDTCVDQAIIVDTMDATAIAKSGTFGYTDSTGEIHRSHRYADTLHCKGWVTQSKSLYPEWDQYIKFFVKGIGNNDPRYYLKVQFQVIRRQYVPVRAR